jgi:hypothetical protein
VRLLEPTLDRIDHAGLLANIGVLHLDRGYDSPQCGTGSASPASTSSSSNAAAPRPRASSGNRCASGSMGRRGHHHLVAKLWAVPPHPGRSPLGDRATHAWGDQYGKLRWCTERRRVVVEFWLALANAAIVGGRLLRRAWTCDRWQGRPPRRP